jgi:membrane associated rhomboid family serine protease
MGRRSNQGFFESPHAVTYTLILLNSAAFALCLSGNSLMRIDPATLLRYGAIHQDALSGGEYWRFIAYAFLHANVLHFGLNMLCIAAWSGLLESRLGATYFTLVYLASAIGGGLASAYGHAGPFLGVGASGAISGIVGALLSLTILGRLTLSPQFFVITIGGNVMLAARIPHVDWLAHLGGFTAGFAACALLDGLEGLNRYWLRCKFPEFVKFALALAAALGAGILFLEMPPASGNGIYMDVAVWTAAVLLAIKLADLILSRPKGLAMLALAIAALYAAFPIAATAAIANPLPGYCLKARELAKAQAGLDTLVPYIDIACGHTALWPFMLPLLTFVATILLLRPELRRGLNDVGFIANNVRAERKRRPGV